MRTINLAELSTLRATYEPVDVEAAVARVQALDWPEERKAQRIERIKVVNESNAKAIEKFDRVMEKLKNGPLAPDTHGGDFDAADLWNGALMLIKESPLEYQIEVRQAGLWPSGSHMRYIKLS